MKAEQSVTVHVYVKPGSKKESIHYSNKGITVFVRAPAHEGKANEALVNVLQREWLIPKRAIEIVRGDKSRYKVIRITVEKGKAQFITKRIEDHESSV